MNRVDAIDRVETSKEHSVTAATETGEWMIEGYANANLLCDLYHNFDSEILIEIFWYYIMKNKND